MEKTLTQLDYIKIEPQQTANASVIWLHGLGASGHDFEPIAPMLELPDNAHVRFIFPHAPQIPVTVNGGYVMPAWYDILEMSVERNVDTKQLISSSEAIRKLIDQEVDKGIPSNRIVLAGFSQGGAVAYHCALSYKQPLAGILALSTYFPTSEIISRSQENQQINIRICHGTRDDIVPESLGLTAQRTLDQMGYKTRYSNYMMGHEVNFEELKDISIWFQEVFA